MPVPRCAALRRDGLPCGALASSPEAEFCRHDERLIEQHGEPASRDGCYPKGRRPRDTVVVETITVTTNGSHSPAQVRPALAEAAAASLGEIQQVLLDAALGGRCCHGIALCASSQNGR